MPKEFCSAMENNYARLLGVNQAIWCVKYFSHLESIEELCLDEHNEISVGYGMNGVFLDGSQIGDELKALTSQSRINCFVFGLERNSTSFRCIFANRDSKGIRFCKRTGQ